ncbi:RsmE family RNA methyltransferase [Candidatus Deianiraea vastatrix]|uniref:Ribosomal RNA small subunit methyltransferase E n=1 Tax=Candidatus Deianiraea vastatrix TaxID=2163644 RepID=A0A5B8XG46_9RICK|nr:16S rRNA (uracil(1498)-N(3))-methyltransferase [Candidatus Deianiraea vastatrix]QED23869.1 Ribosomal RNA small subunit methyltransferase E [Candidatus Deianiraea vastatrix]
MRCYVENISHNSEEILIEDDEFHHIKNVMRIKNGQEIIVFNNEIEFLCTVLDIQKKSIIVKVVKNTSKTEKKSNIYLMPCIVKGDKMSEIFDIAVQFAVCQIQPIISQNSHVKDINIKRMEAVMQTSLKQSSGMLKSEICNPVKFADIVNIITEKDCIIYGDLSKNTIKINSINMQSYNKIFALIGPEGGITKDEYQILQTIKNSFGISLSSRILRAENATCAILANIYASLESQMP